MKLPMKFPISYVLPSLWTSIKMEASTVVSFYDMNHISCSVSQSFIREWLKFMLNFTL
jgi:hypothetical protein